MIVGDVVPQSVIRVDRPNIKATFKPETGKVAMLLLLGHADKKDPDSFDSVKALNDLGWVQADKYEDMEALLRQMKEDEALIGLPRIRARICEILDAIDGF